MMITGWWQLKYFLVFTPKLGEDEPILTSIFFKWVGSTTNQEIIEDEKRNLENF